MRLLFIVCESSVDAHVIDIVQQAGAIGFTRFTGATGTGRHGRREGTPVWPGLNSLVMASVPEDSIEGMLAEFAKIRENRSGRLALQVFSVASEELF